MARQRQRQRQEVCSVPRAIEFVEAHDKDLWYRLIEHSLKNEAFLAGLLDHAGVYDVDLARLVAEIPKGMHIPGLRDKVVKIISDYHFQVGDTLRRIVLWAGLDRIPPRSRGAVAARGSRRRSASSGWAVFL